MPGFVAVLPYNNINNKTTFYGPCAALVVY